MLTASKTPLHVRNLAKVLGAMGQGGDSMVAHINPHEAMMLKAMGGSGTINPKTGLREFNQTGPGGASGGQGGLGGANGDALGGGATDHSYGGGPGNQNGSGAGAGGGHAGEGGYVNNYPYIVGSGGGGSPPPPASPPIVPTPQPPVTLAPLMSQADPNLLGTNSRFGPTPSFATTPYQIGTVPTSFPTPGVNPNVGASSLGGMGTGIAAPTAGGAGMPAVGSPQAIQAGIGTFPNGTIGQATAGAYSPQMLSILSKFGITPNPVQHQLNNNRQSAWHGVTQQNMAHPFAIPHAPPPVARTAPATFNMIGNNPGAGRW